MPGTLSAREGQGVTNLGSIGELVGCEIDLAKGTLSYQLPQGVVPDMFEVLVRELATGEGNLAWAIGRSGGENGETAARQDRVSLKL